jgi:hypothetical protein
MVELPELRRIAERKRQLQAQSELQRQALRAQWDQLRAETAWLTRGVGLVSRHRLWLLMLAPVAGYLVARRGRGAGNLFRQGLWVWRLWRRLRSLMGVFKVMS